MGIDIAEIWAPKYRQATFGAFLTNAADAGRALDFAESVLILERGRVVWSGASRELRARRDVVEHYIGVAAMH